MAFNDEMDRYLRDKRRAKAIHFAHTMERSSPSWWDELFRPRPKSLPNDELTPEEEAKLHAMETEIKHGEELEQKEPTPRIEAEQEQRVSLYQQFRKLFQREHKLEDAYEQIEESKTVIDTGVTDDFRRLAQIQVRWLERLPTRVKDEFRESPDYSDYVDILQRRGVARKK